MNLKSFIQTPWSRQRHIWVIALLFLPLFFAVYITKISPTNKPNGDAQHYLSGAYNILEFNTFSGERGKTPPSPQAYRSPAYSWFLAQGMRLIPALQEADYSWFKGVEDARLDPKFIWLKYVQLVLLLAMAALVALVVLDMTRKLSYAHWALWIIAFHPMLHRYVQRFYSELFGSFLVTCFSALFYFALKKRNILLLGFSGIFLGLITLTFTQWKYVMPFVAGAVVLFGILEKQNRLRLVVGALFLIIGFQCVIQPWKIRNEELLGRNYLSGRGGEILLLRSYYDQMDATTYACSFLYWTYGLPKSLLKKMVNKEHYKFLIREHGGSAIDFTRKEKSILAGKYGEVGTPSFDKALMDIAIKRILETPLRHLLVSIPIGYRCLQDPTLSVFNLLIYFFFAYAFFTSLKKKEYTISCILIPPIALISFNALVTHGLPRYSWQLVPVVWIGALWGIHRWRENRSSQSGGLRSCADAE